MNDSADQSLRWKGEAGEAAVRFIAPGMVVGLGTGSTAIQAMRRLAERLRQRMLTDILAVPTSLETEQEARRLGIPLTNLESDLQLDVVIDGADEVDPALNLIKGGGGALLREKIVAQAGRRLIIVVDESKLSPWLGGRRALPVEVIPFGWKTQQSFLEDLGATVRLRRNARGKAFATDQGNFILDCRFGPIRAARQLAQTLDSRAGIVTHGLFLQMATDLIVAGAEGIEHRRRNHPAAGNASRHGGIGNPTAPDPQHPAKGDV